MMERKGMRLFVLCIWYSGGSQAAIPALVILRHFTERAA
jgi:hypothetical protein